MSGPTNSRLRMILPLKNAKSLEITIGKGQKVELDDGKITVIDDSFQHTIKNVSDEPVIVLVVDFAHPNVPQGIKEPEFTDYGKSVFTNW